MALRWTSKAHRDLVRLNDFLAPINPRAAANVVRLLLAGVERVAAHPRIGRKRPEFGDRDVRSVVVGDYEVRYEIRPDELVILCIWHTREDR